MTFKIEKGIQIPSLGRPVIYPFHEMEINDSFFAPMRSYGSVKTSASNYARKHAVKFSLRKVDGGVRVWRIA